MTIYEFAFIAQQNLTQNETDGLVKELILLLSQNNAKLEKYEYWGLRDLAYSIDKMSKGHYYMMYITSNNKSMIEFERKVKLHEYIKRYLLLKVSKIPEGDSCMMKTS